MSTAESLSGTCSKMCRDYKGGARAVAFMLDMSPDQLSNRIYEKKGQCVSVDLALDIQHVTESTEFAKFIAKQSGGVFVKLPENGDILTEDIKENAIIAGQKLGEFFAKLRTYTADGELTKAEQASMAASAIEIKTAVAAVMVFAIRTFAKDGLEKEVEEMMYGKKGGEK